MSGNVLAHRGPR